jgi:hypothetical protein
MGLMMIHYEMTVKRMGMLAVNVRKMKALTVKMDGHSTNNEDGKSDTDWLT